MSSSIPPHLNQRPWLEFEEATASALCNNVAGELKLIAKKCSAKHVHDTRVALRRWDSIWQVLERDGWRTKKYWQKVGKELKTLRKLLGDLRDWDVNFELAETLDLPEEVLDVWLKERARAEKKVKQDLRSLDIKQLIKRIDKFVRVRPQELRREIAATRLRRLAESAYTHLEPFLDEQEQMVRRLERRANTPETLHQLRLCIKGWRYLLTEFFGLTNLELVKAQQLLGKYNDVHRVLRLLTGDEKTRELAKDAVVKLEAQSEQLMKEFTEFRKSLPYGLRPSVVSLSDDE
ncbi:MAG TPA: CHAD domain-containing protein [Planktothrix sp.]|jgi:CHAD domain-containing protein